MLNTADVKFAYNTLRYILALTERRTKKEKKEERKKEKEYIKECKNCIWCDKIKGCYKVEAMSAGECTKLFKLWNYERGGLNQF